MKIAIIEIEFDYGSNKDEDIEVSTQKATDHAHRIARELTDDEPRVAAANVKEIH